MAQKITIKEVVTALNNAGYSIICEKGKYRSNYKHQGAYGPSYYTERELYKMYRDEFKRGRGYKKIVKDETNGMDRAAKRDMIKTEKFDNIPSKRTIKEEDIWAYD